MVDALEVGLSEGHGSCRGSKGSFIGALEASGLPVADAKASQAVETGLPDLRTALFNGDVTPRFSACVTCASENEVAQAVRTAADHDVPLAVLAGGHDLCCRAFQGDNLILDLRPMSKVSVDTTSFEVTFEGGALIADLLAALPEDLVTVTGTVSSVGMAGFTLGGGYGRLNSRYGLAVDSLKRARVVLADGSTVVSSDKDDADLLWALRGGGSGFGVVTSMTMSLHVLSKALTAMIVVPLAQARMAMLRYQAIIDANPVDLSVFAGFMTPPGASEPMLFMAPLWCGDFPEGEVLIDDLTKFPDAQVLQRGRVFYRDTFDAEAEKAWPKGRHYDLPTRTIRRIDETSVEVLLDGARRLPSPKSAIVLHDCHGAPSFVAPDATAFRLREDHIVVEIVGAWDPSDGDDGDAARAWAASLSADLDAMALPGGYVSLLRPDEDERVRQFYGASARRLEAVKQRVDPADLFRSGTGRTTGSGHAL